ncbi:MAG: metallophosphoesterase family protein [Betaproteobacteria bacterium]
MSVPGRNCPLSYRYRPQAFAREPELAIDSLWVAGGLYGNPFALESLLELYQREPGSKALVFNGDFHWFDADEEIFASINAGVLHFPALRGNVETELLDSGFDAGCGCAYPDWVDDGTVERSNAIMRALRAAAREVERLVALPMHLVAQVGAARVGIVHGDAGSLAGWGFSQEALRSEEGLAAARSAFDAGSVDIFASSHTCLPVLQRFGEARALVNNGAAGMPNFRGTRYGLATRISVRPSAAPIYGVHCGGVHVEAVPLRYRHDAWVRRFVELWPDGSPAHRSYYARIMDGPSYALGQALRDDNEKDRKLRVGERLS